MKFIPGTRFINRTNKNTRLFPTNVIHILNDVKKDVSGEITYIFLVDRERKEIKFNSIKEADIWLETILV